MGGGGTWGGGQGNREIHKTQNWLFFVALMEGKGRGGGGGAGLGAVPSA